jgi:hypothetical protein
MASYDLSVLLAEKEFSETGITLRAMCAGAGWSLELVFVEHCAELVPALETHCPDVAFLQLRQPDAAARLHTLHRSFPNIPLILLAHPADTIPTSPPPAFQCRSIFGDSIWLKDFARAFLMLMARFWT